MWVKCQSKADFLLNHITTTDFIIGREISFLKNSEILSIHIFLFSFFYVLPEFENVQELFIVSLIRCLMDSYSKSRAISKSIEIAISAGKYDFLSKFLISLIFNQLGKYLFERFLINSRGNNSQYKNWAIIISICLASSTFVHNNLLWDHKYLFSISLLLFMGNRMDTYIAPKNKVRSRKQGQNKLLAYAKT